MTRLGRWIDFVGLRLQAGLGAGIAAYLMALSFRAVAGIHAPLGLRLCALLGLVLAWGHLFVIGLQLRKVQP